MLRFDQEPITLNGVRVPSASGVIEQMGRCWSLSSRYVDSASPDYYKDTKSAYWDAIREAVLKNSASSNPEYFEFLSREKVKTLLLGQQLFGEVNSRRFYDSIDWILDIDGNVTLLNVQVNQREIRIEQRIQAAAQWQLAKQNGIDVKIVAVLRFGRDGVMEIEEVQSLDNYWMMFVALSHIEHLRSKIKFLSFENDFLWKEMMWPESFIREMQPVLKERENARH